jgi:hypothetical protein
VVVARPWSAILDGELAVRAERRLEKLVAERLGDPHANASPALHLGAGDALMWAYLERARPGRGYGELADERLARIVAQLAESELGPSLHGGFVGVAWVVDHLMPPGDDDPNEAIDSALLELLERPSWTLDFDLVSGLVGLGVYALGRLRWPTARSCLERVVAHLERLAVARGSGLAWLSRPELRPAQTRAEWPRGYYGYGVAHGAAGVALVLAGAIRAGVAVELARPLLQGALRWLWAGQRADPTGAAFFCWEQDGVGFAPARLGWCYGDPGIVTTVHAAASAIDDAEAAERALAIARHSTRRRRETSGVADVALCHGAAGLGLLYARLAHATSEALFASAARQWYAHLLDRYDMGIHVSEGAAFLSGATGVVLALLAGLSSVEPAWDRLLAASLPPAMAPNESRIA